MKYIDINKDMIPYRFDITLADETYTFEVNYNALKDYFTIDLYKNDEVIVLGEKLVYGKPLFLSSQHKDIPKIDILPLDLANKTERITFENFNKEVFLFLVGD
ncbi:phage baseplate plug family protein [Tissierella praeacuta]|uniref:phage baseplate plug family protein n=1 Tax=Tissierella praeacuta TaxID=43131 RepID=UPI003DA36660